MRHPHRHGVRLLVVACALWLSACAGLSGLERAPRVSLVTIKPVQIELLEQRYLATIRIQNPNPVPLAIDGLDYTISVNDSRFAEGVSSQRVTVPAYGEKTLQVGVTSTLVKLFDQFRRLREFEGTVTYVISGTLGISGIPSGVSFEQDGEIDLRLDAPAAGRSV